METKTHWKKLHNPDYLGAYSLSPGQELILTIKSIGREMVTGDKGKKTECTVVHFAEPQKPMILNRLNSKTITAIYGSPYIEDWPGKKIQVYVAMVDAFGEQVEALRIRPFIPQAPKPELKEEMPAFAKALKFMEEGGAISKIEEKYLLTDEIKEKLCSAKKD